MILLQNSTPGSRTGRSKTAKKTAHFDHTTNKVLYRVTRPGTGKYLCCTWPCDSTVNSATYVHEFVQKPIKASTLQTTILITMMVWILHAHTMEDKNEQNVEQNCWHPVGNCSTYF